jgi:hypothetical protein
MQRTTPTSSSTPTFPPFSVGIFTNPGSYSRPTTRDGSSDPLHPAPHSPPPPIPSSGPSRESRKASFSRKSSLSGSTRRRGSSVGSTATSNAIITDAAAPPALPEYALPAAAKVQSRELNRRDGGGVDDGIRSPVSPTGGSSGFGSMSRANTGPPPMWQPSEASSIHQQITEVAGKRISTLDYLRMAYACHLSAMGFDSS